MKRSGTGSGLVQILTKLEEKAINVGKDLSLVKDIEIPRTYELSKVQFKSMESSSQVVRSINEGQQYRTKSSNTTSKERTQSCGKSGLLHAQLWGKYTSNAGKQIILLDCVRQITNRYMKSRRAATKNV